MEKIVLRSNVLDDDHLPVEEVMMAAWQGRLTYLQVKWQLRSVDDLLPDGTH